MHSHSNQYVFLGCCDIPGAPCFVLHFPCSAPNRSNQISFRFVKDPEGLMPTKTFLAFLRFPLPYKYLPSFIFHVLGGELLRHIWGRKLMYACRCTGRKRKFLRRLLHPGASPCFSTFEPHFWDTDVIRSFSGLISATISRKQG